MAPYAPGAEGEPDRGDVTIQKLAFEVAHRINQATPITPISLVTLALLGSRDRALTVAETMTALESFLEYVRRRRLPVAETLALDTEESVEGALQSLGEHGVVSRFVGGSEIVYSIEPDQHLAAAYYRNTIIHFFVDGAIAEVALLAAAERDGDRLEVFWEEVMGLRDLLKFEFFFPDKEGFRERIREEMARHRRDWEPSLRRGRRGALDVARAFEDYWSPWVLRPFIEAYRVAADALTLSEPESDLDDEELVAGCMALGRQYLLQRRIRSQESVSTVGFETAMHLAAKRGLMSGDGPERTERREAFAAEIRSVLRHLDGVEALAAARRAGVGG
jgi:glycerol-3-phosphate O-acyltransferase